MSKVIAVYQGDEFLSVGTYKEVCEELKIGYKTLQSLKTRFKQGKVKDKGLIIIEVEDEQ